MGGWGVGMMAMVEYKWGEESSRQFATARAYRHRMVRTYQPQQRCDDHSTDLASSTAG